MSRYNRVAFLDYDGVLNDTDFLLEHPRIGQDSLDPKRLSLLKALCDTAKTKVVLTSSWRNDMGTRRWLKSKWGIPVIGATPRVNDNRGQEIHQWIQDSKFKGNFIIIDDEASDLTLTQRRYLICTREPGYGFPKLGLEPKHIDFALGIFNSQCGESKANNDFLEAILENIEGEWLRVMGNLYQKDCSDDDPWRNTGNIKGYKNDTFEVHAYDWGWDYDDESNRPQPTNFRWRDLEITWYKYCGRGLWTNRPTTHDELAIMLDECLESLREEDRRNDAREGYFH